MEYRLSKKDLKRSNRRDNVFKRTQAKKMLKVRLSLQQRNQNPQLKSGVSKCSESWLVILGKLAGSLKETF